ncbi:CASP-like protein 2B1 [Vitis vinifera]|uniref:CASP-like protein n=1 Tax=Vitis vinifera TaxID=29760 RepID=A0A438HRN2_VITVI|nr:CASP-like protein 2B1 [Vitis vinifera]
MSYLGVGVSPGNVPVYHGTNLKVVDRRVRLAELVLRCVICGLGILAAVLVGTDTQVKVIFTIQKKAKFTDMKALVFLVIANGIAAAYSLIQGLRCVVSMVRGSVLFSKPLAWAIFSGDQSPFPLSQREKGSISESIACVTHGAYCTTTIWFCDADQQSRGWPSLSLSLGGCLSKGLSIFAVVGPRLSIFSHVWGRGRVIAYLTLAAVAAAAQSSVFGEFGQPELQWMKICNMYGKFCNQVGEGIVSAVGVSLSMVILSGISAFSLFRLYGGNKGTSGGRW